jgi:hypothetical protein
MLALLLITCIVLPPGIRAASEDPVAAVARKRQEGVKTLVLELKTITESSPPLGEADGEKAMRYFIDGDRVRTEVEWSLTRRKYESAPLQRVAVFDGTLEKCLFFDGPKPGGEIDEVHSLPEPIAIHYRGLRRGTGYCRLDHFAPTGKSTIIDGSACREYAAKDGETWLWFDPGRSFILKRLINGVGDHSKQFDVRYREDRHNGWVLAGWTRTLRLPNLGLVQNQEAEVQNAEFNEPIPEVKFDIKFPPGIKVHDRRDERDYLVQPDGMLRIIPEETAPPTGPRAPESPASETPRDPWHIRNRWLSYAILIAAAVVVCVLYALKKRRRPHPSQPSPPGFAGGER